MAVSKTARTLQSSTSNSAGGTTTGTAVNLTTALGMTVTAKMTNGATPPTVACTCRIEISNDNTNWKIYQTVTGDTGASTVNEWTFNLPPPVMHARSVFTGNTGQAVTVEAFGHELTTI